MGMKTKPTSTPKNSVVNQETYRLIYWDDKLAHVLSNIENISRQAHKR